MSRFKKLSKVRCQQPLVCWHGSVAFPKLPIHIANLSRLSKCTLPIILIPKPLKLSNLQISYTVWPWVFDKCPSWCLRDEWAIIRYSYIPMHFWTVMGDDMQLHCSDAFIQIKWVLFRIVMYWPSGYNLIFCVAVSTELRCFEMPSLLADNVVCWACTRIPDEALGKIVVARKHRALAGCKSEGAVCICKTINFATKFFITNEQYEPKNAELLYYFVYICVSIYLST